VGRKSPIYSYQSALAGRFFALLVDPVKQSARHFFIVTAIGRIKNQSPYDKTAQTIS